MKKIIMLVCITLLLLANLALAGKKQKFGIQFSGFVKTDMIFDTRQTVAAREGHFLLYPVNERLDLNGDDINEKANFNMLAVQTRLKGDISGPNAFGAKTSGRIEGAFFGMSNADVNGFRLRHAFLSLKWENTGLLIGQFWHPMFVTDCFPGTVSFNTGAPFQPFSRNPQVRLTVDSGELRLIAAAMSQRDFASIGPAGTSSIYLRNSAIPNLHGQIQYRSKKLLLGFGGDWKALTPKLETAMNYATSETVTSVSLMGYAKFNFKKFVWKMEGVVGENMTDHLMLGGYGAESISESTGEEIYLPTKVFSAWTDISTGKKVSLGIFAGMTQNLGSDKTLYSFYGRGDNIDMIYRVSPRVMWNSGKTRIATELEYTSAAYGNTQPDFTVEDSKEVTNIRLLIAAYYFF